MLAFTRLSVSPASSLQSRRDIYPISLDERAAALHVNGEPGGYEGRFTATGTPMPLSLVRAWAASGELGKRWIRARNSLMPASRCFKANRACPLCRCETGILGLEGY